MRPKNRSWIKLGLQLPLICIVLPVIFGSGLVGAQEAKTRVAVLVAAQDVFTLNASGLFEHFGMQRLMREDKFELVDSEQIIGNTELPAQSGEFKAAISELNKGLINYENLELVKAIGELACAIDLFEKVPAEVERDSLRNYVTALTYLGASLILKGELQQGQDSFSRLVVYDRRAQLDESIFPPAMIRTFETVRKHVISGPLGSLSLFSNPSHGRVYIDGVFRGITPCTVDNLPVGKHLVVVRKMGFETWGGTARIEKDSQREERCRLLDLPGGEGLIRDISRFASQMQAGVRLSKELQTVLEAARVDQVALGGLVQRGKQVSAQFGIFDVKTGNPVNWHLGTVNTGSPDVAKVIDKFFSDLITSRSNMLQFKDPIAEGGGQLRLKDEDRFKEEEPTPIIERWYFWTGIGVGAATLATLLAVFLPRGSEPESQILIEF
ncbi:MAG: PEGA domain-containing protein [Deltaproteobacteria bacterium]|nr:PEGA domain-containing protein [Deltaproteobacteria bacterium]